LGKVYFCDFAIKDGYVARPGWCSWVTFNCMASVYDVFMTYEDYTSMTNVTLDGITNADLIKALLLQYECCIEYYINDNKDVEHGNVYVNRKGFNDNKVAFIMSTRTHVSPIVEKSRVADCIRVMDKCGARIIRTVEVPINLSGMFNDCSNVIVTPQNLHGGDIKEFVSMYFPDVDSYDISFCIMERKKGRHPKPKCSNRRWHFIQYVINQVYRMNLRGVRKHDVDLRSYKVVVVGFDPVTVMPKIVEKHILVMNGYRKFDIDAAEREMTLLESKIKSRVTSFEPKKLEPRFTDDLKRVDDDYRAKASALNNKKLPEKQKMYIEKIMREKEEAFMIDINNRLLKMFKPSIVYEPFTFKRSNNLALFTETPGFITKTVARYPEKLPQVKWGALLVGCKPEVAEEFSKIVLKGNVPGRKYCSERALSEPKLFAKIIKGTVVLMDEENSRKVETIMRAQKIKKIKKQGKRTDLLSGDLKMRWRKNDPVLGRQLTSVILNHKIEPYKGALNRLEQHDLDRAIKVKKRLRAVMDLRNDGYTQVVKWQNSTDRMKSVEIANVAFKPEYTEDKYSYCRIVLEDWLALEKYKNIKGREKKKPAKVEDVVKKLRHQSNTKCQEIMKKTDAALKKLGDTKSPTAKRIKESSLTLIAKIKKDTDDMVGNIQGGKIGSSVLSLKGN
jgi:uncharacterized protein YdaT